MAVLIGALGASSASAAPPMVGAAPTILPDASFTISPAAPYTAGENLTFTANQTTDPNGGTLSYAWTVDGVAGPTTSSFSQTFAAGSHTITLAVTDSEGDPTQTTTQTITVDTLPSATFTISPSAPRYHPGQSLTFTASQTTDPNGGTLTYQWTVDGVAGPATSSFSQTFAAGSHTITLAVTDSEGDPTQTTTQTITVDTLPSATFTISPAAPYTAGENLTFTANQTTDPNGGTLTYAWTVDGVAGSTSSSFSQTFAAGSHTITLAVTDSEGDPTQTTTQTITVTTLPTAVFTISPAAPYQAGESLTFAAASTTDPNGGTLTYQWTVDGVAGPTTSSFSQTFAAGSHTITLAVTDSEGDPTQTTTQTITVDTLPSATFTISPAPPYTDEQTLTLSASSTADPNGGTLTYAWTVDGVAGSTSSSFSQTFAVGSHTITLAVTDSEGDPTQTTSQTINVGDSPASASIGFSPGSPQVGTNITFTGTRSGDPDDTTVSYAWRFGDGKSGSGAAVQHQYQAAGTFTVVLTVTDDDGTETATQQVHVAPLITSYSKPTAVFTAPSGREAIPVGLDGSASRDPNPGGALGYRWNFGDGGIGAGVHVRHAFRAGTWTVTLTVTDSASGNSNSVSHPVTIVDEKPAARFKAPVGRARHKVAFAGTGADPDGSIAAYRWSFGDGAHARGAHATHTYAKSGRYRVTLTVTDSSGKVALVSHQVVIGAPNACLVPALRATTLAAARSQLKTAQCGVAPVSAPKKPGRSPGKGKTWRLIVVKQTPPVGSVDPHGTSVRLRVAWHAGP